MTSAAPRRLPGPPCGVGVAIGSLTDAEAAELRDLLDAGENRVTLAALLVKRGHDVTAGMLGWHHRGQCSCVRRKAAA